MLLTLLFAAISAAQSSSSPTNSSISYAPTIVPCPKHEQWIRPPHGLSEAESKWLRSHKKVALDALTGYLERLNLTDFDTCKYTEALKGSDYEHVPVLGYAISGGGTASSYTGTGGLRALDNRIPGTVEAGTGGLLQVMSYMSGLSGGAWPTVGLATYDFLDADSVLPFWQPELNRYNQTVNSEFAATVPSMFADLAAKFEAGFNVSAPDFFGRVWAYAFVAPPSAGDNQTWSGIQNMPAFKNFTMPCPIVEMCQLTAGDEEFYGLEIPSPNFTYWEATPFEWGNWDDGFIPTEYMGTPFSKGSPANPDVCVNGFDKPSFMIGVAGAALNYWLIEDYSNNTLAQFPKRSTLLDHARRLSKRVFDFHLDAVEGLIQQFQTAFGLDINSTAYGVIPNPFADMPTKAGHAPQPLNLSFVDGAESGQAIPLWPHIQPARGMNLLMAWDDDEDAQPYSWNNGTNLYNTYVYTNTSGIPFPKIPPPTTFINKGYVSRPTLFGCNKSLTTTGDERSPIVLYLPNSPWSAYTNYSGTAEAISREEINQVYVNSWNLLTQGNGTLSSDWINCLGCAVIERSLSKVGMKRTQQCDQCFQNHCWDGTEDDAPVGVVDLPLALDPGLSFAVWNESNPFIP